MLYKNINEILFKCISLKSLVVCIEYFMYENNIMLN
jgi:hypothetical protein